MDNANFGKLISILRNRKGITQRKLADELGVTTSAVSKWENGKNMPDAAMSTKLCTCFNITLDELFNPAETIERLQNGTLEATPKTPETTISEADPEPEPIQKKWYQKKILIPLLGILIILGVVIALIIINKDSDEVQNCSLYSVRTCIDKDRNAPVYEMAYLYSGAFDYYSETPFVQTICKCWLSDPNAPQDIDTLKISFYNDEYAAAEWQAPFSSIYFYRED